VNFGNNFFMIWFYRCQIFHFCVFHNNIPFYWIMVSMQMNICQVLSIKILTLLNYQLKINFKVLFFNKNYIMILFTVILFIVILFTVIMLNITTVASRNYTITLIYLSILLVVLQQSITMTFPALILSVSNLSFLCVS
jgi:hypothetical protein